MADSQAEASSAKATSSTTPIDNDNDTVTQLRRRLSRRTLNDRHSPLTSPNRRRSSLLSYGSFDEAAASLHGDILQPSSARKRRARDDEISHWDSTPLAFAILPALAGILFTNGSAFVTDVLLLAFAAVFLNWSIRVPRDWYYSAQAVRQDIEPGVEEDESAIDESDGTPKASPAGETADPIDIPARQAAADQLKTQETMSLLATFLFPALAAYLLHVIRSQLSLPSTSLVSDYNISIFLLAAEFWPARQVIRLVAARTLHLQRTAAGLDDPFADSLAKGAERAELLARVAALETKLEGTPIAGSAGQSLQAGELAALDARIQKRLEPRLDSLERAVRRYEKRYTTLAMVSEQRFQNLETRLQDALSLAAAAAQQGQRSSSIASSLFSTSVEVALLPAKITWELVVWPYKILDEVYDRAKVILLGPQSSKHYNGRRRTTKNISDVKIKDDKIVREKQPRKLVR